MGIKKLRYGFYLKCDAPGCKAHIKNTFPRIKLNRVMEVLGYQEIAGRVYCSTCAEKRRE